MPEEQTPSLRYRRLALESLEAAKTAHGERRVLLQMASVWQRLSDQYGDSTPPFFQSGDAAQPVMQQQQQVQSEDDEKS